jgi:hypothetical protein
VYFRRGDRDIHIRGKRRYDKVFYACFRAFGNGHKPFYGGKAYQKAVVKNCGHNLRNNYIYSKIRKKAVQTAYSL